MNSSRYQCNRSTLESVLQSPHVGAYSFGVAEVAPVDSFDSDLYNLWIGAGLHDSLEYMEKYSEVRADPSLLLGGAKSIIVCAFPYTRPSEVRWHPDALRIASYALGDDYHDVVKRRLNLAVDKMREQWGGEYRVCVDTAPLHERYWAVKSGLGYIGLNGLLMIPGAGSCFFLGTILTTLKMTPDKSCTLNCGNCRRCIACCPSNAIIDAPEDTVKGRTLIDARKCLSCLTIERRGELPANLTLGNRLYGCDTCQSVCPHNRLTEAPEPLPEFQPRPELLSLTKEKVEQMTHEEYCRIFKGSAIKRAKLEGLKRNATHTN
ncbi:MAG: tRNA epoxyqueuosine(34) reductase QueG [Paramuribaculum sp.]|nr:tRNA epoxyqueuosine(34) reductase QueG [Paramuribaculum sp.]